MNKTCNIHFLKWILPGKHSVQEHEAVFSSDPLLPHTQSGSLPRERWMIAHISFTFPFLFGLGFLPREPGCLHWIWVFSPQLTQYRHPSEMCSEVYLIGGYWHCQGNIRYSLLQSDIWTWEKKKSSLKLLNNYSNNFVFEGWGHFCIYHHFAQFLERKHSSF